jgi:ribonuclease HII
MLIAGVDEVGRGCLAGPLVAGAVVLRAPIPGLKDSKKLTKKQRERLAVLIRAEAVAYSLGWVDAATIDAVGITIAVKMAMQQAVDGLDTEADTIIVDGNINYLKEYPSTSAVIRADDTVPAVSAASILAKVARDEYMTKMAVSYPSYGFDRHVGYGTALHLAALRCFGACVLHRKSFGPVRALVELKV